MLLISHQISYFKPFGKKKKANYFLGNLCCFLLKELIKMFYFFVILTLMDML